MQMSFDKWLNHIGIKSYVSYRNALLQDGLSQRFVDDMWNHLENTYKEEIIKHKDVS